MRTFFAACIALTVVLWNSTAFGGFEFRVAPTGPAATVGDMSGTFSVFADYVDTGDGDLTFNTYEFNLLLAGLTGSPNPITIGADTQPSGWIVTGAGTGVLDSVGDTTTQAQAVSSSPSTRTMSTDGDNVELARFTYAIPDGFAVGDTFTLDVANGRLVSGDDEFLPVGTQSAQFGVVPEPSSAMLVGLLGLATCMRRRRS